MWLSIYTRVDTHSSGLPRSGFSPARSSKRCVVRRATRVVVSRRASTSSSFPRRAPRALVLCVPPVTSALTGGSAQVAWQQTSQRWPPLSENPTMGAVLGVPADTREIREIYESSTVLPLIGGDQKDRVIANSKLKRIDERRPIKPTAATVLLVIDGCVDLFKDNTKTHTITATRSPAHIQPENSLQTAARRARFDVNGAESVWDDEVGGVQCAELLVYWRGETDVVCRYSCPSGGDEVILRSATGDRVELRHRTKYLTIGLKSFTAKGAGPAAGLQSINALTNSDLVELVGHIPFFAGIPRDKLVALTDVSTIRVYPPRSTIFREDEGMSTQMYVTLAGTLEVSSSRAATPLATLEPGSFFGEMSLLINIPRAATVTSVESCLLMSIEKEAFHLFLERLPDVKESVYKLLKERLVAKAIMSGVLPYMKSVPPARLVKFAHDLLIEDHVRKNDVVLMQETTDESKFVIVVYGVLEIVSGEKRKGGVRDHSVFLTPGCYFGPFTFERLNFVHGKVIARSPVVIMSCKYSKLQELFDEFPEVAAEANIAWFGERCDLSAVLRHAMLTQRFQAFLEAEHSDENFKFCLDVQKFRSLPREERHQMATYIVQRYINPDSPKEVNLPASIRDSVIQTLKRIPPTEDVATTFFNQANDEIMRLMTKDSFPRFKKSPMFQGVLDALDPHINRKGSKLLDACHAFRESINLIKPGKVEHVAVAKLQRMLSTIRKSQERQHPSRPGVGSPPTDVARVRVDNS